MAVVYAARNALTEKVLKLLRRCLQHPQQASGISAQNAENGSADPNSIFRRPSTMTSSGIHRYGVSTSQATFLNQKPTATSPDIRRQMAERRTGGRSATAVGCRSA
eukprot:1179640-Rhodomonas_salina.2